MSEYTDETENIESKFNFIPDAQAPRSQYKSSMQLQEENNRLKKLATGLLELYEENPELTLNCPFCYKIYHTVRQTLKGETE